MKQAAAIFVLSALLMAPLACLISACPVADTQDCCPKSKTFATCPFDILVSAKSVLPAVATWAPMAVPAPVIEPLEARVDSVIPDHRDLHLYNRVLRI